jgi:acetoin utilization deacetylase AcuC-like enzyme
VHDPAFVRYLKRMCATLPADQSIYPYVFPVRNATRPPRDLAIRAGYYCIDTFTPINRNAWPAARRAVDCALTGASALLTGTRLAYALVRPPGHHAEHSAFGGFCYLNSAAIAAHYLSREGRVAIIDVDYHHGNGQQEIFYKRADVLTVSIHGHPSFAYPYFTGFPSEVGEGPGLRTNLNFALGEHLDGVHYARILERALSRVRAFAPRFLVVCLGLDTAKADPTGTWSLRSADFERNGRMLGMMALPTLIVQEGGYNTRNLGTHARHFFAGLWSGATQAGSV